MYQHDELERIVAVHNSRKRAQRSLYDLHLAYMRRDHLVNVMCGLGALLFACGCALGGIALWLGCTFWGWGPL